jgi:protease-4
MRIVVWFFAIIGFFTVLILGLGIYAGYVFSHRHHAEQLAGTAVLRLDLNRDYAETASDPVRRLTGDDQEDFQTLIRAVRAAADDDRVKGLVAVAGDSELGFAQVQELCDTLAQFKAKGKFAHGFAESIGEIGGGSVNYYLLSCFDRIWLQPLGNVGLTGLDLEMPFLKGTLDKIGIDADFSRRGEYKSAMTQLTETKLLPTDRVALDSLVHSLYDQLVTGIAKNRAIPVAKVPDLIDAGPYLTDDALAAHLVDHIGYRDEFEADALKQAGDGDAHFVDLRSYARIAAPHPQRGQARIAMIRAIGMITSGSTGNQPFNKSDGVHSDDLVDAIDAAINDGRVKAIVLRIDSPGGSDVASETIWRATQRAREKGKPVIVSMGDTAASGGYYIAAGADKIIAEPGTITGSIGVFGGKIVFDGLWQKIGVSWDHIAYGKNADIASSTARFTPDQRRHTEAMLDQSYHTFVARVAAGRHMTPVQVDAIGRGHVWTGAQALGNGLVDQLGGLDTAVALARKAAGITADEPVSLVAFPPPKTLADSLRELLAESGEIPFQGRGSLVDAEVMWRMARMALDPESRLVMPTVIISK